jgi:hypothetical protein
MFGWEKLLSVYAANRGVSHARNLQKTIYNMMAILALVIVTSILTGGLVVALFYTGYRTLLYYGVETPMAAGLIILIAATSVLLLINVMLNQIQKMKNMRMEDPSIAGKVKEVMNAFSDGFMGRSTCQK